MKLHHHGAPITRQDLRERSREVARASSENRPCQTAHPYEYRHENDFFANQLEQARGADIDEMRAHSLAVSLRTRRLQYGACGLMATSAAAGLWGSVAALADASAIALPLSVVGFAVGMTAYRKLDESARVQDRFRAQLTAWETSLSQAGG